MTEHTYQSLGEYASEAGTEQEWLHPHINQPRHRTNGSIGMQCGHDQVAGQTRLHGNFCGFNIADFAHHDHIWVLAQNRPQPPGKGHVGLVVHLGLANAGQTVFNRVLYCKDIDSTAVKFGKRAVECGGFTGSGGSGNKKNTVGLAHGMLQYL